MNNERQDVYTRITDKIIADLEQGVRTWMKPWNAGNTAGRISRPLRHNGVPYSGINILMLWAEATAQGFGAPIWMTFKQATELNAHVRKGEKGSLVVYANSITRTEQEDSGEETEREIHYMKGYTVFNVEQIEGLPEHYYGKPEIQPSPVERIGHVEAFFKGTGADVRYRGDRAFYSNDGDYIQMPVTGVTYVFPNLPNITTNFDLGLTLNVLGTQITAYRGDGQQLIFNLVGSTWVPDTDVDMTLTSSGSTWVLTNHDDSVETYNKTGSFAHLNSIKTRNGYTQTMAYNGSNQLTTVTDSYGRTLTFTYTGGYLTQVATPDSLVISYAYSSSGVTPGINDRLASTSYNTSPVTSRSYNYANSSFPFNATSVTDEDGNTYESWTYDSYGRALTDQVGTGANANITTITYNDTAGTRTIKNALGQIVTSTYAAIQGANALVTSTRTATANVAAATESFTYDSNGFTATVKDWNANTTTFTNNVHGDPTTVVEATGTTIARTTTIAYDPTFVHLPDTITTTGLTTGFTYDTSGNPLTQVLTDTTTQTVPYSTNGQTRTTHFTWNNFLPATVQTPNGNTTTFTFGSDGALTNIQNALLQNTAITSHSGGGLPLTIVDPNSVTRTLTYSSRNWLLTGTVATTAGNLTTTNTYDAAGNLSQVKQPDGSYLNNAYDTGHRLTSVTDSFGNSIDYTLDALGDRTVSNIENPSSVVTRGHTTSYDTLGRVHDDTGGMSQTTAYAYDSNSNITAYDPPEVATSFANDQLNRWTTHQFNSYGSVIKTYDAHNRTLTAKDQIAHTTSYVYDGFGDVIQAASPDTGTAVYTYDSDGNLTKKVDALSVTTNHTYDALDRLLTTTYPADTPENVAYTYDQTGTGFSFGIGRLTSLTDMAGSLTRAYDERGNLLTQQRVNGTTTLTTAYTYDAASRVLTITYPDGSLLTYTRDAMGRITAVSDKPSGAGSATTLASSVTYEPFGPWSGFTYGNSIAETPTWDLDYRLTKLTDIGTATAQNISYTYYTSDQPETYVDNLTSSNTINPITIHPLAWAYAWTNTGHSGSTSIDDNGNRTSQTGATTATWTLNSGTDQYATMVAGSTTTTISTNANGNITGFSPAFGTAGVTSLSYNNANRLTSASSSSGTLGAYVYDAFGQRFSKTVGTTTTLYQYSGGALIAETTGGTETNYIYLNGRPLAMLSGTTFTYLHDDKLGRPQVATNASQTVVWKASYLPFGETLATSGTATVNLRFAGQYYDAETGFSHNGFRDYVPTWGRYLEADPVGIYDNSGRLNSGMNPYNYVGADPMRTIDPWGLGCNGNYGENCPKDPNSGSQAKFGTGLLNTFQNPQYWSSMFTMTGLVLDTAAGLAAFTPFYAPQLILPLLITGIFFTTEGMLMSNEPLNPAELGFDSVIDLMFEGTQFGAAWPAWQYMESIFPSQPSLVPAPPFPAQPPSDNSCPATHNGMMHLCITCPGNSC